jgi:hypothetical protein
VPSSTAVVERLPEAYAEGASERRRAWWSLSPEVRYIPFAPVR